MYVGSEERKLPNMLWGRRYQLLEYAVKTDQIAQGPERAGEDFGLGLMPKAKPKRRSSLFRILAVPPCPFLGCSPLAPPPAPPLAPPARGALRCYDNQTPKASRVRLLKSKAGK